MTVLTPASEVIERNNGEFSEKRVLFSGDLQDDFPAQLNAHHVFAHCSYYHQWQNLYSSKKVTAEFGLLPSQSLTAQCDTLIFYWFKNKTESQFQLLSLLSQLNDNVAVFIVGENRSGVRSVEAMLADYGTITKIDSARRCSLYYFEREKTIPFSLETWWKSYHANDTEINVLPGVFSHDGLDLGSDLLLSVLTKTPALLRGDVLDIGCGSGVLATKAHQLAPDIQLTLSDVNAAALMASEATLATNRVKAKIVASDLFSNIDGQFDVILSNPPFHEGRQIDLAITQRLIKGAKTHLKPGGILLIVANAFLPYADYLDTVFGSHDVVAQTGKFKVYQVRAPGRR